MRKAGCLVLSLALGTGPAAAATCTADSGAQRSALLELYTSEGCSSCPPADRWARDMPARGLGTEQVVTLAYHVDYWDELGWRDPYAQARFTERQRFANARNQNRTIYTPQFMLDGQDYRQWPLHDDLQQRVARVNRREPGADIALSLEGETGALHVTARVSLRRTDLDAGVFVALYEDELATQVRAGENTGKRLEHDYVVRELAGPFAVGPADIRHTFHLQHDWQTHHLSSAIFVQSNVTGEVLQAMALPWCD